MKNSAAKNRKQVPAGYLVIGVDPHKKKHAAVFMTQDFTTHATWHTFWMRRESPPTSHQPVYIETAS
jgi:hypothetical protein